jgi:hypothetical protein
MTSFSTESLKAVFAFPFKDEKWQSKFTIAVLLSLGSILIVPWWLLLGYIHELMRRIILDGEEPSLPEWDRWGEYLIDGLKLFVVGMVYNLPVILLIFASYYYPISSLDPSELFNSQSMPSLGLVLLAVIGLVGVAFLLSSISTTLTFAAIGHMIAKQNFWAAFDIRGWWPILWSNRSEYFLSFTLLMGTYWMTTFASQFLFLTLLCCLYPVFVTAAVAYLSLTAGGLYALAYRAGAAKALKHV